MPSATRLRARVFEPEEVDGELGRLYRAYRVELERLGAVDRELLAGRAAALSAETSPPGAARRCSSTASRT